MSILRNYVRSLLLETLAIDAKTFENKLKEFVKEDPYVKSTNLRSTFVDAKRHNLVIVSGIMTPYLDHFPPGMEASWDEFMKWNKRRPTRVDFDYLEEWRKKAKEDMIKRYSKFAEVRGWNLLKVSIFNESFHGPHIVLKLELDFDQIPHKDASNVFSRSQDMSDYYLYHMTLPSVVDKIMSSGFRTPKISTDGKLFGNGRGYFVAIEKSVPEKDIIDFFNEMLPKSGFAGKSDLQAVLKIDPMKMKKNIKFYKDTEWSGGTGKIPTQKTSVDALAIYTPTFIKSDSIIEVINL